MQSCAFIYLHAHKIIDAQTPVQAHLARENAVRHSVSTAPRLCTHLHFGACPGREWGKEWRNQAHAFPFEFAPSPRQHSLHTSRYRQGCQGRRGRGEHGGSLRAAVLGSSGTCTTSTPSFPGLAPPSPSARALRGRTVHSYGSARAASSFLPVLPTPGRRAGARSRRELSGNPPRGGWPGALTSS